MLRPEGFPRGVLVVVFFVVGVVGVVGVVVRGVVVFRGVVVCGFVVRGVGVRGGVVRGVVVVWGVVAVRGVFVVARGVVVVRAAAAAAGGGGGCGGGDRGLRARLMTALFNKLLSAVFPIADWPLSYR